jgi:hypothetical protein
MKFLKYIFDYERAVRDKNEIQEELIAVKRSNSILLDRLEDSERAYRDLYSAWDGVGRENLKIREENIAMSKDVLAGIRAVGKALRGE